MVGEREFLKWGRQIVCLPELSLHEFDLPEHALHGLVLPKLALPEFVEAELILHKHRWITILILESYKLYKHFYT